MPRTVGIVAGVGQWVRLGYIVGQICAMSVCAMSRKYLPFLTRHDS